MLYWNYLLLRSLLGSGWLEPTQMLYWNTISIAFALCFWYSNRHRCCIETKIVCLLGLTSWLEPTQMLYWNIKKWGFKMKKSELEPTQMLYWNRIRGKEVESRTKLEPTQMLNWNTETVQIRSNSGHDRKSKILYCRSK